MHGMKCILFSEYVFRIEMKKCPNKIVWGDFLLSDFHLVNKIRRFRNTSRSSGRCHKRKLVMHWSENTFRSCRGELPCEYLPVSVPWSPWSLTGMRFLKMSVRSTLLIKPCTLDVQSAVAWPYISKTCKERANHLFRILVPPQGDTFAPLLFAVVLPASCPVYVEIAGDDESQSIWVVSSLVVFAFCVPCVS